MNAHGAHLLAEREERRSSVPPLTCSSHCCIIKQHCADVLAPQVTSTLMYSQILTSRVTFNRTRVRQRVFIRDRSAGRNGKTARRLSPSSSPHCSCYFLRVLYPSIQRPLVWGLLSCHGNLYVTTTCWLSGRGVEITPADTNSIPRDTEQTATVAE